jgi:signal transduction histidine kinase/Na+/proline symporter
VYSLALATYCTTWTFYGSVGYAVTNGVLFLGIYLGPTAAALLWWWVLRKLVRLKNTYRLTSLADLFSVRYEKSQLVAVVVTVALLVGLLPYLALQLKTMIAAVALVTGEERLHARSLGIGVGVPIVVLMIVFTIAFGIRRLSPTERHPGMVAALATECGVKLVAFVAAGAFVTYGLFDGIGDLFHRALASGVALPNALGPKASLASFLANCLLAACASLLLPRQFHIAVVENSDEGHIRTAMWLFPLYMLLISFFVVPIAVGGLTLGQPAGIGDTFVLRLPFLAGAHGLTWLVLLGGFSAGAGMIMVETMALATMISNHLVLPVAHAWHPLRRLRRHLLPVRWCAAAVIISGAFAWERLFAARHELVAIGLVSFVAVLQIGPALFGGLYWRGASKMGALMAITSGFGVWAYTLILPVVAREGWVPAQLLTEGPAGIRALRPEALLAMGGLDNITHAVLWSLLVNVSAFVAGSLLFPAPAEEEARSERVIDVLEPPEAPPQWSDARAIVEVASKRERMVSLFSQYHGRTAAERLSDECVARVSAPARPRLTALQLASLEEEVETTLGSIIGTAGAHEALREHPLVTPAESRAITGSYAKVLTALKVPPAELQRKITHHRERERRLAHEAEAQRFLAEVSGRVSASLDLETTARTVAKLPVPRMADASLLWLRDGRDGKTRAWVAHADVRVEAAALRAFGESGASLASQRSIAAAAESRRPVVSAVHDPTAWPFPLLEGMVDPQDATFPLIAGGRALGTLTLFVSERGRLRFPGGLPVGEELAHRSALAIENALLFQSAEDAVRARDEFLAIASHELKTPLTPLHLNIQSLQRVLARTDIARVPPHQIREAMDGAASQVRRMVSLVDDLLDLSRITTRRLRLRLEPVDLGSTVRDVVERHRDELAQVGCSVAVALSGEVVGRWDRVRVEQVFTNLLTNAMKYAGGVIDVRVEGRDGVAFLAVCDQGPGISLEDQERIFLPFERAVSYLKASGFGLGLYIVRLIVEAHGGRVRLESAPGRGSAFTVELPLRPAGEEREESAQHSNATT